MERDPALRLFERDALVVWGALTGLALVLTGGRLDAALGVAAGGALMAVSYLGIKGGAHALVAAVETGQRRRGTMVLEAVKFLGRYALLALAAYVILARLRLHPVGVLVGATVPVIAAAMQVPRLLRRTTRPKTRE